ncbi:hypothetical protein GCM10023184_36540 [Flaviaesturariibacter amylovorans]|uniref:Uncharacterized protein n=1 Tax=Flaviaesturariibacter amylovorans TaxID=1084520 RepID=A0ABP8HIJ7_9BACT
MYFLPTRGTNNSLAGINGGISPGYLTPTANMASFSDGFAFELFVGLPFGVF